MTALARYSIAFYDLLAEDAKEEIVNTSDGPGSLKIYRGHVTRLWNQLGGSNAYYSKVMRNLTDLGCIAMLQRGAASTESVVAVIRRPDADEISGGNRLTTGEAPAILRAEVEAIKRNVGGINIPEVMQEFDTRLKALEREVGKIVKTSQ